MLAMKIGRNDPCYCGSGKKYKFCCMEKSEQVVQSSDSSYQTVSEAFALGRLLATTKPFRAFYDAERRKITGEISWTNTLPMPAGLEAQAIRLPTSSVQVIYLRHIPAAPQEALAVAHELMHLVLDAEGFPFVASASQYQALAALLNSLGQDSLIDARLRQYGYDIAKKVQKEIKAALARLVRAEPPRDHVGRMMWVLNYAGQVLECSAATSESTGEQDAAFKRWFQTYHPTIAADGDKIIAEMRGLGFHTPDGMRVSFAWIIQRYQLPDDFIISVRGQSHGA
jgi:hypothetical protein